MVSGFYSLLASLNFSIHFFQSISICRSFLSIAILALYQSKAVLSDNISSDSDSNSDNDSDNDSYNFRLYTHALTFTLALTPDHN